MKLLTTLAPRTNGTVICAFDKARYVFAAEGEDGGLVCEVEDEAVVAKMLALPHFEPADEADYDKAEALLQSATPPDVDDEAGEPFFSEVVNGGLPVERAVPADEPRRKPGRPKGSSRAPAAAAA